jgi:hypothetical protein
MLLSCPGACQERVRVGLQTNSPLRSSWDSLPALALDAPPEDGRYPTLAQGEGTGMSSGQLDPKYK